MSHEQWLLKTFQADENTEGTLCVKRFSLEHEPANYMSDFIMKIFPISNVCEALWYLICLRRIWNPCISTALSFMHNYEMSGFTMGWNWRHRWERHWVFRRNTKECKSGFWRLDTDWTGRIWKDEDWNPPVNFFSFRGTNRRHLCNQIPWHYLLPYHVNLHTSRKREKQMWERSDLRNSS